MVTPGDPMPVLQSGPYGAVDKISHLLLQKQVEIEAWLRSQWALTPAPFYSSVDLRNAGFKIAPVDTNLFPAGFNNLPVSAHPLCIQALQAAIERVCPAARQILIIPESHTRNLFYLESLASLVALIERSGFLVRIGSLIDDLSESVTVDLPSGGKVILEPVLRTGNRVGIQGYDPDLIILNNDLSGGLPAVFTGVAQPILPPPAMGWHRRTKTEHFTHYQDVAVEFAEVIGIDPWLIDPYFRYCGQVNFKAREGQDCLIANVEELLSDIKGKYRQYGIDLQPFVMVKSDAGTYGMNVMTVTSIDDIVQINRKQRVKMSAGKEGLEVSRVLIQEGVHTIETLADGAVAEPVVYMIDRRVVGGFYRVHKERGPTENLNAPGMHFEPLAFSECCTLPDPKSSPHAPQNRLYTYGLIARLASLAAAREIDQSKREYP